MTTGRINQVATLTRTRHHVYGLQPSRPGTLWPEAHCRLGSFSIQASRTLALSACSQALTLTYGIGNHALGEAWHTVFPQKACPICLV
jgi:hypothetical protein